ncbi:phage tail sheath protein FI [Ancylobacter sp. 3268]|uniref:phage tail sheath family protein n=1 Tax=Ancylobacter sp. 3268 TaxID=2817752 RepID=UPI002864691D|nr:phage tail sheath subtilisin-like domain-containing protein [Ancylobacter sp. 3268]MDR6954120.1 phage tail sheath protein FI [Ancylobacter sp. 3268]
MADLVLHGLETTENTTGPRPIETIDTGIIALIGTAPDANSELWPLNTVVPVYGANGAVEGLGESGTLLDAIEGIFDQATRVSQTILVVRVAAGGTLNQTFQNILGSSTAYTGVHAFRRAPNEQGLTPKIFCSPGFTSQRPTDGVASIAVGTAGSDYAEAPAISFTGGGGGAGAEAVSTITKGIKITLGAGGTGYTVAPTVVIEAPPTGGVQATATATVAAGAVTGITVTNPGSGYINPPAVSFSGAGTGAVATAVLSGRLTGIVLTKNGYGYAAAPTVVIGAPAAGGTQATATATLGTAANPVIAEMLPLAAKFRAVVIKDGPSTTTAAAITDRADYDTDRLYIVDPTVKVFKDAQVVPEPVSARVAGLIARVDYTEGFWVSPSNHVIEGIIGTGRPIEHSISDPSAESQLLNRNAIACVVRAPSGGLKLWGNRVPSSDSLKLFLPVRRAHDTIIDSIERACEPFIDKPFSLQNLVDIGETVSAGLRRWQALGATLGGRVWLDPTLNTAATWAAGHLYIHYDSEAPAPMEHITFVFNRNTGYYDTLSAAAIREIARIGGTVLSAA